MAYSKVPKACSDGPVGFQTINALGANLDSLKAELELEHTAVELPEDNVKTTGWTPPITSITGDVLNGGGLDKTTGGGKHNHPLIARGIARVETGPTLSTSADTVYLYHAAGVVTDMQVIDTGVYFFPIAGLSKVWGKVAVFNSGVTLVRTARVVPAEQADLGTGLLVYTFEDDDRDDEDDPALFDYTGDFALPAHVGFYLIVFGRP